MKKTCLLAAVLLLLALCPRPLRAAPAYALETAPAGWVCMTDDQLRSYARVSGNNCQFFSGNLENMPATGRTAVEERTRGSLTTLKGVKYTTGLFVGGREFDYRTVPATVVDEHPGEMYFSMSLRGDFDRFRAVFAVMESGAPGGRLRNNAPVTPPNGTISISIDGVEKYNKTFNSRSPDELVEIDLTGANSISIQASGILFMICEPFFRTTGATSIYPGTADTFIAAPAPPAQGKVVEGVLTGAYKDARTGSYVTLNEDMTFTMSLKYPQGMIPVSGKWGTVSMFGSTLIQLYQLSHPQDWKPPVEVSFIYDRDKGLTIGNKQWGDVSWESVFAFVATAP